MQGGITQGQYGECIPTRRILLIEINFKGSLGSIGHFSKCMDKMQGGALYMLKCGTTLIG